MAAVGSACNLPIHHAALHYYSQQSLPGISGHHHPPLLPTSSLFYQCLPAMMLIMIMYADHQGTCHRILPFCPLWRASRALMFVWAPVPVLVQAQCVALCDELLRVLQQTRGERGAALHCGMSLLSVSQAGVVVVAKVEDAMRLAKLELDMQLGRCFDSQEVSSYVAGTCPHCKWVQFSPSSLCSLPVCDTWLWGGALPPPWEPSWSSGDTDKITFPFKRKIYILLFSDSVCDGPYLDQKIKFWLWVNATIKYLLYFYVIT